MTTTQVKNKGSFWDNLFEGQLEHNRFGVIPTVLIIVSCTGGFVMGSGGVDIYLQLIATVFLTMTNLVLILAVQPLKLILNIGVITFIVELIFICFNLLQ